MSKLLLIESVTGIIFMLLVTFIVNEDIARTIITLYGVVWTPAILISTKIYNNAVSSEDDNSEAE